MIAFKWDTEVGSTIKCTVQDLRKFSTGRLGKAFCDMNCFKWDTEVFGDPPEGWESMDNLERHLNQDFRKCMILLDMMLSQEQEDMYWWILELGKTYAEWKCRKRWHCGET